MKTDNSLDEMTFLLDKSLLMKFVSSTIGVLVTIKYYQKEYAACTIFYKKLKVFL